MYQPRNGLVNGFVVKCHTKVEQSPSIGRTTISGRWYVSPKPVELLKLATSP